MTLAERLFRGKKGAKAELQTMLRNLDAPSESIGWDGYDQSVEIYGALPDFRLTAEAEFRFEKYGAQQGKSTT